jgi:hypothetical protein
LTGKQVARSVQEKINIRFNTAENFFGDLYTRGIYFNLAYANYSFISWRMEYSGATKCLASGCISRLRDGHYRSIQAELSNNQLIIRPKIANFG